MRLFFAVTLFLLSLTVARAQSTLTQDLATQEDKSALSGNLSLAYNSNFARQTEADSEQSVSAEFVLNYNATASNVVRVFLTGEKQLTQGQEWLPGDGYAAWVNGTFWRKGETLTIGQQVRIHAPMSRDSRDRDSKETGVSLIPVFMVTMTPSLSLTYQPNFTRNFHTYETNRLGNRNAAYGLSHSFIGNWLISDSWYFQPTYIYRNSWSYGGTQRNPSYLVSGELGYTINPTFTIAAGWTNDQMMSRTALGPDRDFESFNNNTSTFYTALFLVF